MLSLLCFCSRNFTVFRVTSFILCVSLG
jgi:hypothetical protein